MKLTNTFFRKNPLFDILTTEDFIREFSPLNTQVPVSGNSFFLIRKDNFSLSHIIPLDISTADCLYSFEQPKRFSASMNPDNDTLTMLYSLVFDHIIEVQNPKGHYESGPSCSFIKHSVVKSGKLIKPIHTIGLLSQSAIKYAWQFRHLSIDEIVKKLYCYGTIPHTHGLYKNLITTDKLLNWLNISGFDHSLSDYRKAPVSESEKYWHYWQHKKVIKTDNLLHKIYLSPTPEETPEVFAKVLALCRHHFIPAFKIGASSAGIHRPDKIVLYFDSPESVFAFASAISSGLSAFGAQGVPFSSPLTSNGILSFAKEPIERYNSSWRIYVCRLIARILKLYSFASHTLDINHIYTRLNLAGIDTNNWNKIHKPYDHLRYTTDIA